MTDIHVGHAHEKYRISCDQFDEMIARTEETCWLCRTPWEQVVGRPVLDHDHQLYDGTAGVRGLVCRKCNAHMRHVDAGDRAINERTQAYLDNAWHLTAPLKIGKRRTSAQFSFRLPVELLDQARATADAQGHDLSWAIRVALEMYVSVVGPKKPPAK